MQDLSVSCSNTSSKLGIGFMRYDLNKDNQPTVDWAMAHGINYFETCYFYLDHQCENYVYSLLQKYNRESYEICGKLSLAEAFSSPWHSSYKEQYAEQLKRVPGHYFDVYLLQTLRPQAYFQIFQSDLLEFFDKEKQKGNIRAFGFSEQCDSSLLKSFLEYPNWDIAQMPLNYYDWYLCDSENNYNLLTERNIPIIAQAPFKGGELIHGMENIIPDKNLAIKTAIDFVISKSPKVILTGCSQIQTLSQTYDTLIHYDSVDLDQVENYINTYRKNKSIPCVLCNKCYCPEGISIPLHFCAYNRALNNKQNFSEVANLRYFMQDPINQCVYCGACVDACPLHLNIPKYFFDVFNLRP